MSEMTAKAVLDIGISIGELKGALEESRRCYAEGLTAWSANNAHHASEIERLRQAIRRWRAMLEGVLVYAHGTADFTPAFEATQEMDRYLDSIAAAGRT